MRNISSKMAGRIRRRNQGDGEFDIASSLVFHDLISPEPFEPFYTRMKMMVIPVPYL
jgi:hypothetical protein